MNWHSKSIEEVTNYFRVTPISGLSSGQVRDNRDKFGKNFIPATKAKPAILTLLEQFNDPIIYILIIAAILNAIFSDLKDTIVIATVVFLNTIIGFVQERKASDALKALRQIAAPMAKVIRVGLPTQPSIRDSVQQLIETTDVVCGDVIVLESGMRVPADARLVETQNLIVDESMLTGEAFPVHKQAKALIDLKTPLAERITMTYSGTIIQKGRGLAIVTEVGNQTEFGKITKTLAEAEDTASPLSLQMEKFGKGLSIAIMTIVALIFITGFLRGNNWLTMMLTSVGLAVSAIPEGLPVAVTVTLSIGLYQMAKKNAIVKKLAAVETLGSTNVICTDKTGTLTRNQMTVLKFYTGFEEISISGTGYDRIGTVTTQDGIDVTNLDDHQALKFVMMVSSVCTESAITLDLPDSKEWTITGDPTEAALMIAAQKLHFKCPECKTYVDIPFESENQLMAVSFIKDNHNLLLIKGAPEKILENCTTMLDRDANKVELNTKLLQDKALEFSEHGLRVLAMAYMEKPNTVATLESIENLTFVGFAGIYDAARPEAAEAVNRCHGAGIRVIMITGDNPKTAQTIAKHVNIAKEKDAPVVITGMELDEISDDELFDRVPDIDVYARVAPHHKYRIVQQIQKHNKVVAMTGDGVNDAPALKQADIGVAMGSGTDVAKESAQMILMDDNFATIVNAVRRGRVVLHNLQHIILYILATSLGGLLTIAMSVAVGFPLPILPAQLLWINLVTDGTSTFPLAFEKEHGNVMVFRPRERNSALISRSMVYRVVICGFIMMLGTLGVFWLYGHQIIGMQYTDIQKDPILLNIYSKAQTMAFCVLAFFQIWNVQNSRSEERSLLFKLPYAGGESIDRVSPSQNPILLGVMLLAILLQVSAVALPFMNDLLDTVPLCTKDWLLVIGLTFSIIIIVEIIKISKALYNKARGIVRQDVNLESLNIDYEK